MLHSLYQLQHSDIYYKIIHLSTEKYDIKLLSVMRLNFPDSKGENLGGKKQMIIKVRKDTRIFKC